MTDGRPKFIHVQVDPRDEARIARLMARTELPSKSELVRAALRALEANLVQEPANV